MACGVGEALVLDRSGARAQLVARRGAKACSRGYERGWRCRARTGEGLQEGQDWGVGDGVNNWEEFYFCKPRIPGWYYQHIKMAFAMRAASGKLAMARATPCTRPAMPLRTPAVQRQQKQQQQRADVRVAAMAGGRQARATVS